METALVWFRRDLRLEDNPAFAEACRSGRRVLAVFLWAPEEEGVWAPGGAARWWLHGALEDLDAALRRHGTQLILRRVAPETGSLQELQTLLREVRAGAVYWNRRYEPEVVRRDAVIKAALRAQGFEAMSFNAHLLFEPWTVATQGGGPYRVFTPFKRAVVDRPVAPPTAIPPPVTLDGAAFPQSVPLESLRLRSRLPWSDGLAAAWRPTRAGAESALQAFLQGSMPHYPTLRDIPGQLGTSRLSPYLAWGQIGIREVAAALVAHDPLARQGVFWSELLWREFAHHVLHHFPETPAQALQPTYQAFPWKPDEALLAAWQAGRTGYPIIDAGMRQLWRTGWMHNRVRMIVGSFLVKHLLQPWQAGARWFWDTLVDADLANNTLGWQWVGGCGADAAPYFRVFNPILQGEKFDAAGDYVRTWLPELQGVPNKFIQRPWEAPGSILRQAGVVLGADGYPRPVIEHALGRARALAAFAELRQGTSSRILPLPSQGND